MKPTPKDAAVSGLNNSLSRTASGEHNSLSRSASGENNALSQSASGDTKVQSWNTSYGSFFSMQVDNVYNELLIFNKTKWHLPLLMQ